MYQESRISQGYTESHTFAPLNTEIDTSLENNRIFLEELDRRVSPFVTGIECSDPKIKGVRRNQLAEAHNFYENYECRLENVATHGIKAVRFGEGYSLTHPAPNIYNFEFSHKVDQKMQQLDQRWIADLLHFGVSSHLHSKNPDKPYFQNPALPEQFAEYAELFAKEFPHVVDLTVVNEPQLTAIMSALCGKWNEGISSPWDADFPHVTAVKNIAKSAILGRQAIERVHGENAKNLVFWQNENAEKVFATPDSGRQEEADFYNLRRFAALDLINGHYDPRMHAYLTSRGMTEAEFAWFMDNGSSDRTVIGIDHYPSSVVTLSRDGTAYCCTSLHTRRCYERLL